MVTYDEGKWPGVWNSGTCLCLWLQDLQSRVAAMPEQEVRKQLLRYHTQLQQMRHELQVCDLSH